MLSRAFDHICMEKARYKFSIIFIIIIIIIIIISGKACLNGVDNNDAFLNVGNMHTKKNITYEINM